MTFSRSTLSSCVEFEGRGLHSGAPVRVTVSPGERGIWFYCGAEEVQARPENITDTTRCTRLGTISTIEHLMSAFAAAGVTDAEVELSAPELPALDGASREYLIGLCESGLVELGKAELEGPFARVFEKDCGSVVAIAKGQGHWRYVFDTGDRWPEMQDFELFINTSSYLEEISDARTFAFEEELEQVRAAGLGQGLDETTALVLGKERYINNALYPDEPARHKLLDLIDDLYLSGIPPVLLDVVAEKSGHTANVRAAAKLAQAVTIKPA